MTIAVGSISQSPHLNLPLSGEVPRRGGGGTEVAFGTVLQGKAYGIPPYPPPLGKGGFLRRLPLAQC